MTPHSPVLPGAARLRRMVRGLMQNATNISPSLGFDRRVDPVHWQIPLATVDNTAGRSIGCGPVSPAWRLLLRGESVQEPGRRALREW